MMKYWDRTQLIDETARELAKSHWSEIEAMIESLPIGMWNPPSESSEQDKVKACEHILANLGHSELEDIAAYVGVGGPATRMWEPATFRLFITHVSPFSQEAQSISEQLSRFAVSGFVAHANIAPLTEWDKELKNALFTAHALAALLTDGFSRSEWAHQEVGVAIGRRLLIVPVLIDEVPSGLMSKYQAIRAQKRTPEEIAQRVFELLLHSPPTRQKVVQALIARFESTASLEGAKKTLDLLEKVEHGEPVPIQLGRVNRAASSNDYISTHYETRKRAEDLVDRLWDWGVA